MRAGLTEVPRCRTSQVKNTKETSHEEQNTFVGVCSIADVN